MTPLRGKFWRIQTTTILTSISECRNVRRRWRANVSAAAKSRNSDRSAWAAPAVSASAAASASVAALACCARSVPAWSVGARAVAALACCNSRAVAPWPVDSRAVAAWSVDARAVGPLAYCNARPAPTAPTYWAAPAQAATPAKAALIPTRSAPTSIVPAKSPPSPTELNQLYGSKFICCRLQGVGVDHGGMRAPADHYTHDRERRGQSQAELAHDLLLVEISSRPVRQRHRGRASARWFLNQLAESQLHHASLDQRATQRKRRSGPALLAMSAR